MNQKAEIAKRENAGALATNVFEADAGAGSQNITQEDLALPFLKVLGQLSPEVNKQNAKFISGAEPGMIVNSVTKELYDGSKGINVIPVHYERQYVEWQDRGQSGNAPVAIHSADSDIVSTTTRDKSWKDRLPNGNYLENTANHFVILMGKSPSTALISMKATQLKISRKWNSLMMGLKLQGKNGLFASGLRTNALIYMDRDLNAKEYCSLPEGTHNARIFAQGVLFNDTKSDCLRSVKRDGTEVNFKIPTFPENELTHTDMDDSRIARQGFARGLCLFDKDLVAVGSSPSTISIFDLTNKKRLASVNLSMDIRNAIHGLEVWPYERLLDS